VTAEPLEHEITLALASGATLKLLYFSDREQRWIFSYAYVGDKAPGAPPEIANDVRLTANYVNGELTDQFVLSMHVIVPSRLGQSYFAGVDISPGAKTFLEFTYERQDDAYRLVEICKGARVRVVLAELKQALVRAIDFPFPVADRIPVDYGVLRVPFRRNHDVIGFFELPKRTLR
jgi:hypothetical protein